MIQFDYIDFKRVGEKPPTSHSLIILGCQELVHNGDLHNPPTDLVYIVFQKIGDSQSCTCNMFTSHSSVGSTHPYHLLFLGDEVLENLLVALEMSDMKRHKTPEQSVFIEASGSQRNHERKTKTSRRCVIRMIPKMS